MRCSWVLSVVSARSSCCLILRRISPRSHVVVPLQHNRMEHYSKLIFPLALCLFACARQGVPTGGPKDTTPPAIDTLASTPNFATRFEPKRLELIFKEWITLSEAAAQVVVSPPLVKRPEVLLRGKKVIVKFDENEKFRENTTYTINFGTSVKDLHEGNPAKDLRFVFSTGDYIDSLSSKGKVVDAFSGEPVENVAVMLYDNLADTVVRKERPYYFSRTDKLGLYEIRNIKAGSFKVVAVEDLDQNLRWDGDNERIGFLDTTLLVRDTAKGALMFQLFKNPAKFRLGERNATASGYVKLKFSTSADSAIVTPAPMDGLKILLEKNQDSILVWYDIVPDSAWTLFVNQDTVPVKARSREDFLKKHPLRFAADIPFAAGGKKLQQAAPVAAPPVKTIQQNPLKTTEFLFNYPILAADTSKWVLISDSLRVLNFMVKTDSVAPRRINLEHPWLPGKSYQLALLPGAVTDFWGQTNNDTLRRVLNVPADKQLGGLNLRLENLRPAQTYIVQLLDGATVIEERVFMADKSEHKLVFAKLNVTTYTARIIEDRNRNGRWDTGDYWAHRQPEPLFSKKLEPMRANWEVEATLPFKAVVEEKKKKK